MQIKGTQLFIRKTGITGKYLVCGLLRTDEDLPTEAVVTAIGNLEVLLIEDREDETVGMGLDHIITSPIWRLK